MKVGDEMWKTPGAARNDSHPVVFVSCEDATKYCQWLSVKDGKSYRLPTEAEWEYACRAGTTPRYSFGDDHTFLGDYAWFLSNSKGTTHAVGEKRANGFGLHDMHGNVWEWVWDCYGKYNAATVNDPLGPPTGGSRVRRGGSWGFTAKYARSASRSGPLATYRDGYTGFRVLRVADGANTVPSIDPAPSGTAEPPTAFSKNTPATKQPAAKQPVAAKTGPGQPQARTPQLIATSKDGQFKYRGAVTGVTKLSLANQPIWQNAQQAGRGTIRDLTLTDGDSLLLVLSDKQLSCYDALNGKAIWMCDTADAVAFSLVDDQTVTVRFKSKPPSRFDAKNGRRLE